ncbi:unnamed protein product [Cuscuta epithymum]|uniref:RRM domain-containing protein n=1 Tax=Cuscuta epithymum TaxID=186058 RepID=A0AAV0CIV5_9ASTE|nr:unnamed protein product [Cuscuta epithymum]
MSLHLGNIPPHIHRDELEHVFQRFGRCTVRLKDKFGFVVYDYPANAEKALNSLRGKTICGNKITLSWSNRQPQPKYFQRFSKSERRDDFSRDFGHNGHRHHKRGFGSADTDGGKTVHAELVDNLASHHRYEESHTSVDGFPDDSGGGREATVLQNGEQGEKVSASLDQNGLEDGLHFDRYVPSSADEISEFHHLTNIENAASPRRSEEKTKLEPPNASCNTLPSDSCVDVKKDERSRKRDRSRQRDSSTERTARQSGRKNYMKNKFRKPSTGSTRYYSKNDRAPVTNSTCSGHAASGSHSLSRSLQSLSQPSNSMPKPSLARRNSRYSSLRSGSTTHSRSTSPTSDPLCASLEKSLSSSSNTMRTEKKDLVPELKVDELKGEQQAKIDAISDNSVKVLDLHASESHTGDYMVETGEQQNNNNLTEQHETSQELKGEPQAKKHAISDNSVKVVDLHALESYTGDYMVETADWQNNNNSTEQHESAKELKGERQAKIDAISDNSVNVVDLHAPESYTGDYMVETGERQNNNNLTEQYETTQELNPASHISQRWSNAATLKFSSEELGMVLKHYRLEHPEQMQKDLTVEDCFGCARLWPWDIIYYRRYKKGHISTENYNRRLAQNKEFGIVDKYVRSSSGWGEM